MMVTLTLAVPAELKTKMDAFPEINWSAVARQAFNEKIADLELLKEFKADSTMTEADAIRLGKELKQKLAARYR